MHYSGDINDPALIKAQQAKAATNDRNEPAKVVPKRPQWISPARRKLIEQGIYIYIYIYISYISYNTFSVFYLLKLTSMLFYL